MNENVFIKTLKNQKVAQDNGVQMIKQNQQS